MLTNATHQQIETAKINTAAKLCSPAGIDEPLAIASRGAKSGGVWQTVATFPSRDGRSVRIEAIGRGGADVLVLFEVGNAGNSLPVLNAFAAELEIQGVRARN